WASAPGTARHRDPAEARAGWRPPRRGSRRSLVARPPCSFALLAFGRRGAAEETQIPKRGLNAGTRGRLHVLGVGEVLSDRRLRAHCVPGDAIHFEVEQLPG